MSDCTCIFTHLQFRMLQIKDIMDLCSECEAAEPELMFARARQFHEEAEPLSLNPFDANIAGVKRNWEAVLNWVFSASGAGHSSSRSSVHRVSGGSDSAGTS